MRSFWGSLYRSILSHASAYHTAKMNQVLLLGEVAAWFPRKLALAVSVVTVLAGAAGAQTLTDRGATAPTPGANDISQLSTSGNTTFPDGLNYYTDNETGHSAGEPGQTFTTGSNPRGYILLSVSLMTAGLNSYSGIGTPQPYYLHIYSVSGDQVTLLQT
ncbi:hypothetical protein SBV1_1860027 [Verrucomicrobia bacterium]|nr:hypothetical protein SBV1_1860027 [Verrucomicrobiota bacterium]